MNYKRSKLQIYLDILKVIKKGTKKPTRIMYKTNLSWKPLMSILDSMLSQDLIGKNQNSSHVTYEITDRGRNVLNYFNEAMKLIEIS